MNASEAERAAQAEELLVLVRDARVTSYAAGKNIVAFNASWWLTMIILIQWPPWPFFCEFDADV